MLLHFVFLVAPDELQSRAWEFEYIQQMAQFYKKWIKKTFSVDVDVQSDQMLAEKRSILQKIDTATLLDDHRKRDPKVFHFYLCNFRPMWTDCTCEGYYAENFGMIFWQRPKDHDALFLAERNCTAVSHELSHEFLRQKKVKNQAERIHDIWTKHLFNDLPFEQYGKNFEPVKTDPYFLTIDASSLR
jgi:hypothetical protein